MTLVSVVPVAGLIAVLFAIYLARDVLSRDTGTAAMQEVAGTIFEGAMAFLRRQYQTIGIFAVITAVVVGIAVGAFEGASDLGVFTAVAFLIGALCSAVSGYIGMYISVRSNLRTAAAAQHSLKDAITVSLRGGAVSGFLVVALSLLGVWGIFSVFHNIMGRSIAETPFLIVGFGFGASFVALFAQLGGGIYTKAADVGADLVGKVEQGIPEDDPRNAAVVADLVGDNVGDCAGRGADLFESMSAENIGAMILGVAIFQVTQNENWIFFPLVLRSAGIVATIIGLLSVSAFSKETGDPMNALSGGYWVTSAISVVGLGLVTSTMLGQYWMWFFLAGIVGIITGIIFVYITQYYTAGAWRPVQEIANASRTGPATNIIIGTAVGFETTAVTAITVGLALVISYALGDQASTDHLGNLGLPNAGIFGTAVATMSMLMSAAYVLAMDTFGPITDNAGGITEMAHASESARHITDALDSVGNTTKALTKGYAVGSAALAAFLLFSAYLDKVKEKFQHSGVVNPATGRVWELGDHLAIDLSKVEVFVGALLGVMLVFLFSSLAIRAVGKAAGDIINEVRRQFRENPGIMQGTVRPDYGRAVDITTTAALREMVAPGILAVGLPLVVGLAFRFFRGGNAGWESVAGLLMVGTIGGIILATYLNNGGGAWDNAKKFIESGQLKDASGAVLGKGSDAHAAAVVGDTVGDPFKDTAGPSLHVLVKMLSTVTLVLAPLFIS